MKRHFRFSVIPVVVFAISVLTSPAAHATNGHQLSAIGAYQQGMAGATTAAPYDATTAISNPAGMAMIGARTDFSFQTFFPNREVSFDFGGGKTSGGSNWYLVPAIGWTAPMHDRQDLYFGGGMYGVSGMGVDYDTVSAPFMQPFVGANPEAHIWSQYQFWKMAPTVAWKKDNLALGFALNLDYQAFGFENYYTGAGGRIGFDLSEMQGALGFGAAVGIIYDISPAFRVGASYTSKQYFGDFKWRLSTNDVVWFGGAASTNGIYKMNLDFPRQAAVGIAVKPFRNLLWTVDAKWINYSDTYDVAYLKGDFGPGIDRVALDFGWDDVWVYATALQFDISPKFAIRVGYNHSDSPIDEADVDNNLAFPAIVEDRIAGGFTYRFGRHWELTMAYMKALKNELISNSGTGTTMSLEEQAVDMQISYRF